MPDRKVHHCMIVFLCIVAAVPRQAGLLRSLQFHIAGHVFRMRSIPSDPIQSRPIPSDPCCQTPPKVTPCRDVFTVVSRIAGCRGFCIARGRRDSSKVCMRPSSRGSNPPPPPGGPPQDSTRPAPGPPKSLWGSCHGDSIKRHGTYQEPTRNLPETCQEHSKLHNKI